MGEIKKFPMEVIEQIKYYVYKLIDPRNAEVFYIGKGKANRVFNHIEGVLQEDEDNQEDGKIERIRQIKNAGFAVIHVIHRHGLEKETAIEIEAALIDDYQGLLNIQGGQGSNEFGPMHVKEIIEKYQADEAEFGDKKVVMITINKSFDNNEDIYFATRFAWKMNLNRVRKADIVCAVVRGIIKAVYVPNYWDLATFINFTDIPYERPERVCFKGVPADAPTNRGLIGKRVSRYQVRGASYPIKYNY